MSPRFKFEHWLPRLLQVDAITLYPYVLFAEHMDDYEDSTTIRHEMVHVAQVRSYGWFRFYISYLLYYAAERVKGEDHYNAYLNIPWEVEARAAEGNNEPA